MPTPQTDLQRYRELRIIAKREESDRGSVSYQIASEMLDLWMALTEQEREEADQS